MNNIQVKQHSARGTFMCPLFFVYLILIKLLYLFSFHISAQTLPQDSMKPPIHIAVLDTGKSNSHQQQVVGVLKSKLKCPTCVIKTFPIFDKKGNQYVAQVLKSLDYAAKWAHIINLSWNIPSNSLTKPIETRLNEIVNSGIVVVGAAGSFGKNVHHRYLLKETAMGKVDLAMIVGEADIKNRLHFRSVQGSGFFAIDQAPKGLKGSSFIAPMLTAEIANFYYRHRSLSVKKLTYIWQAARLKQPSSWPRLKDIVTAVNQAAH